MSTEDATLNTQNTSLANSSPTTLGNGSMYENGDTYFYIKTQPPQYVRMIGYAGGFWFVISTAILMYLYFSTQFKNMSFIQVGFLWASIFIFATSFGSLAYSRSYFTNTYGGDVTSSKPTYRGDNVYANYDDFKPLKDDNCTLLKPLSSRSGQCFDFHQSMRNQNDGLLNTRFDNN